jgi:membrane protease YdiL (CAAX protease family)
VGEALKRVILRFAVFAALLIAMVAFAMPERLFDWPRTRPRTWLAVVALYPVLSVLPQEFLYRRFLFARISPLVAGAGWPMACSALAFAGMHGIYQNTYAVVLTLIGGWFFGDTYRRTHSLKLVCLEHALYGNLVFSIGLGSCFSGSAV